ncbi:Spc97 / Spc98 family of spindle pole body (SBP) component [Striga hermonthica]|uniref:Spc97 / Spc98 family of spindle pole body (SBP) component n=1 Tax=Striga hermonthica TaxID=68872 RepID=A0A9N7MSQ8_STRHE|nr:Spc97 / Spc98 family of spindle pole body (SBP) component [Striga hermonthica]
MRAQKIGHEDLTKKFDLRMLRTLSFVFMEHLKGQLKDKPAAFAFDCNLLKKNVGDDFGSMSVEDLFPYFCSDQRKRITDMFHGDMPPSMKQKKQKQASEDSI